MVLQRYSKENLNVDEDRLSAREENLYVWIHRARRGYLRAANFDESDCVHACSFITAIMYVTRYVRLNLASLEQKLFLILYPLFVSFRFLLHSIFLSRI